MTVLIVLLITLAALIVCGFGYSFYPGKRPFPTESDYGTRNPPWWHLYYASKYLRPVKRARRQSGLEELFARDMSPDPLGPGEWKTVRVGATGDLMCRKDLCGDGGAHLWNAVGAELFSSDLSIGNLEFVVNPDRRIEKIVQFSVPPSYAFPLLGDKRFGSFRLVSLANNHINDSGTQGIVSTCRFLEEQKIDYVGAQVEPGKRDCFPLYEIRGVKIAVLSYAFSTNGLPLEPSFAPAVNVVRLNALDDRDYDPSLILHHIGMARERGADLVIACLHWGVEFEYYPPQRHVRRAHDLIEAGVDVIVGHHPHILNPVERYRAADGRSGLILYSLGNLTSWALKGTAKKLSLIASIEIQAAEDPGRGRQVRVGATKLTPVLHVMRRGAAGLEHRLVPVLATAREIREGRRPEYLSPSWARRVLYAEKEFKRHFTQSGIEYC